MKQDTKMTTFTLREARWEDADAIENNSKNRLLYCRINHFLSRILHFPNRTEHFPDGKFNFLYETLKIIQKNVLLLYK